MTDDNPSIISHISIGTDDLERAGSFYDQVLGTLGCVRIMEHPGAIAYGKQFPEFWVQTPLDEGQATAGNGVHIAFMADSAQAVDEFHRVALASGGRDNGAPGPRPIYGDPYYGCFVLDLDGNHIEATFWDEAQQS